MRSRSRKTPRWLAAFGLLAVLLVAASARAATKERRFSSAKHGLTVEAPAGWTLSLHTGYPNIIALLLHPTGSRVSIAVSDTKAPTVSQLVEQNRRGLEAQGLIVDKISPGLHNGVVVDAHAKTGEDAVRQYYLVRTLGKDARQALVVTLTTKQSLLNSMGSSLDQVLGRLVIETPEEKPQPDAGAGKPPTH